MGGYTAGDTVDRGFRGLHLLELDTDSGKLECRPWAEHGRNPSWVHVGSRLRIVWTCDEVEGPAGTVSAFTLPRDDGTPRLLGTWASGGGSPCHLAPSADGRFLGIANYACGTFGLIPLGDDGLPAGPVLQVPGGTGSHAHMAWPEVLPGLEDVAFLVSDLGRDCLRGVTATGTAGSARGTGRVLWQARPGDGPRHLAALPGGGIGVIHELSGDVSGLAVRGDGLEEIWRLASPVKHRVRESGGGPAASALRVLPLPSRGARILASYRGRHNLIASWDLPAGFPVTPGKEGMPTPEIFPLEGRTPRDFTIARGGRFVVAACQDSQRVDSYWLTPEGMGSTGFHADCPAPTCIAALYPET